MNSNEIRKSTIALGALDVFNLHIHVFGEYFSLLSVVVVVVGDDDGDGGTKR